eukprot:SAG31_NODE_15518_length_751_cov_0.789877_1_plen_110_part_10
MVSEGAPIHAVSVDVQLTVATINGTVLHSQEWPKVNLSYHSGEMGVAVRLPGDVSWAGPTGGLDGDVVLFDVVAKQRTDAEQLSKDGVEVHSGFVVARQLYTFGVLSAGT